MYVFLAELWKYVEKISLSQGGVQRRAWHEQQLQRNHQRGGGAGSPDDVGSSRGSTPPPAEWRQQVSHDPCHHEQQQFQRIGRFRRDFNTGKPSSRQVSKRYWGFATFASFATRFVYCILILLFDFMAYCRIAVLLLLVILILSFQKAPHIASKAISLPRNPSPLEFRDIPEKMYRAQSGVESAHHTSRINLVPLLHLVPSAPDFTSMGQKHLPGTNFFYYNEF